MRKAKPKKRILLPDPKFGDVLVTRFVNNLMLDGKKSIAYFGNEKPYPLLSQARGPLHG